MKILLGRDDVNPNTADKHGHTPLLRAACYGYELIVEMLLERDDINPNKPDHTGQTPLAHAASNGNTGVVEILLKRSDVTNNQPDIEPVLITGIWGMYRD